MAISPDLFNFATVSPAGEAPKCRITNAADAYLIADHMRRDDYLRDQRRSVIYKCYKKFPPTDYSQLAAKQIMNTSNFPTGMLTDRVNEQKSGYIDTITDRATCAKIVTTIGNDKERVEWSEHISFAFNLAIWDWPSYFYNNDQTLEEMMLYGKGIEIRDEKGCWYTRSYHNSQILIPNGTRANLDNLEEFTLKDTYKPVEFWQKFKRAKNNEKSPWNFMACVDALRYYTGHTEWGKMSNTEYLRRVAGGEINLTRYYDKHVDVYILFVKEYDESVTKLGFLRDYGPLAVGRGVPSPDEYMSKAGFLFCQQNYETEGWENIIYPFHGSAGSGQWHDIKGYAEELFPQCRQYDITTNKIVDGVTFEMMVALKGMSPDQTKKLKEMEWGRYFVMPEDVDFAQRQIQVPIRDAIMANQVIMGDKDRSMANYGQTTPKGNTTAREAELNYSQAGKLDGTALRRNNICQTRWQWGLYKFLTKAKTGWKGYKQYEKFVDYLKRNKVPEDAWLPENIESFDSNYISATGANKVINLQACVQIAQGQSVSEGEVNAKRMLVSALIGQQNVNAILPPKSKDLPDEKMVIFFQNSGLNDPNANIENFPVLPTDNQLEHIRGHFSDSMETAEATLQLIQQGLLNADQVQDRGKVLLNKGGHLTGHIKMLERDKSKKAILEPIMQNMEVLKSKTDEILGIAKQMAKNKAQQQQQPGTSKEEIDLQYQAALNAQELQFQREKDQQKLASTATRHEQKTQADIERASTGIALQRATTAARIQAETAATLLKARPKPGEVVSQ